MLQLRPRGYRSNVESGAAKRGMFCRAEMAPESRQAEANHQGAFGDRPMVPGQSIETCILNVAGQQVVNIV